MKNLVAVTVLPLLLSQAMADDWPCFRGPDRSGRSTETGLLQQWPDGGPEVVWTSNEAGIGYSSFAVVGDRIYTMGADASQEYVIALDATNGRKVWQTAIGQRLKNGWGDGPRSTPAFHNGHVVALGGKGGVVCVDAVSGSKKWSVELTKLGGKIPNWGYSESPLIENEKVYVTPGGPQGTVAAFDLSSGEKLWQSSDIQDFCHYSSIIPVDHFGQKQFIQLTMSSIFGLDENGKLLWQSEWPGRTAVIPTPIYHDGQVYVTSGYGVGCALLNITKDNEVQEVYDNKMMKNHHGGVIRLDEKLFGYSDGPGWVCQDWATGELDWNEKRDLGKGAIAYADGCFYCLGEKSGRCVLIEATPSSWTKMGEFVLTPQTKQRSDRGKVWTHPVIANGRLYLRDQEIVVCYNIRK